MSKLKKTLIVLITLLPVGITGVLYLQFKADTGEGNLNFTQDFLVKSIHKKWQEHYSEMDPTLRRTAPYGDFARRLNTLERGVMERIFGHRLLKMEQELSVDNKVNALHQIPLITLPRNTWQQHIQPQYVSTEAYNRFASMVDHMESMLGRRIYICSGYRSLGRQAYLGIQFLATRKQPSIKNMKNLIAYPGESEHNDPSNPAVDFCNQFGFLHEQGRTHRAYKWMTKHAQQYGFELTYPKYNDKGKMFEPWHWRHVPGS